MATQEGIRSTPADPHGSSAVSSDDTQAYVDLQQSLAFTRLRSRSRRYLTAMAALFLGVFTAIIALMTWTPEPLHGQGVGIDVPTVLAAGLLVLPCVVAVIHLRYAGRRLDPLAEIVRAQFDRSRR
ncbi:DUF485 domain-containing protein [Verrucosispora sp. WMMA2044]|uniref:DUF485 domain-containing protein n=1 Tax=Verrucosispora sp. WMMA2044 TaxID=3016419 RepID=UPI00248C45C0|nr:DUF485 domain-containing protein [Verrucosispora sp. WMMA2044]WBB50437.1 DUF485 domain-containing protein [Verrucosispora sp. WMMA2044]